MNRFLRKWMLGVGCWMLGVLPLSAATPIQNAKLTGTTTITGAATFNGGAIANTPQWTWTAGGGTPSAGQFTTDNTAPGSVGTIKISNTPASGPATDQIQGLPINSWIELINAAGESEPYLVTSFSYNTGSHYATLGVTAHGTGSTTFSGTYSGFLARSGGMVAVANGGTGTATPGLVQGANITITGSFPNQTVALSAPTITTVNTQTDLLALTSQSVGQHVFVSYTGKGHAEYRYNGGGESTAANWILVSDLLAISSTSSVSLAATTTFADTELNIDWVPIGTYEVTFQTTAEPDAPSEGYKWKLVAGGAAVSYSRGNYSYQGDATYGQIVNFFAAVDHTAMPSQENVLRATGVISVTTAGYLKVQHAQSTAAGTTFVEAGAELILRRIR